MKKKLFDYVIGNPPYQEDIKNRGDRANPVYDKFMDAAYKVGNVVELIHPARFLFNAGQTPKAWNKKMLSDRHLKVLQYEPDASKVFLNTDIKGGVAVTLRNDSEDYGAIGIFTASPVLNCIVKKVAKRTGSSGWLNSVVASQGLFRFSEKFFGDFPDAIKHIGAGTGNKIVSSVMDKLHDVFLDAPHSGKKHVKFLGRIKNQRVYKYIDQKYLEKNAFIDEYKVFAPEANNSGHYGEALTDAEIGFPGEGCADTFLCIGPFDSEAEPVNFRRYMKTKFFRALLGIKKVTQHCPPPVWEMIPLQDFTDGSDIDWSESVPEIDRQLYLKYGLDDKEIEFIETHVKEMA